MKQVSIVMCVAVLGACSPPAIALQTVREAGPGEVAACQNLGRVTGVPAVFGPLAGIGLKDARNAAKRTALEQGANTVVFDAVAAGEPQFEVTGTAYRC